MYGMEHDYLIYNKQTESKPMMGYGHIADYETRLREAKKYNSDFFKPKYDPPKKDDKEIEMVELNKVSSPK